MNLKQKLTAMAEREAKNAAKEYFDKWKANGAVWQFGFFEFANYEGHKAGHAALHDALIEAVEAIKYLKCDLKYRKPGEAVKSHTEDCVRCSTLASIERKLGE